jgi:hypothetical protein
LWLIVFCCIDDQSNVVIACCLFGVLIINQTLLFVVVRHCWVVLMNQSNFDAGCLVSIVLLVVVVCPLFVVDSYDYQSNYVVGCG